MLSKQRGRWCELLFNQYVVKITFFLCLYILKKYKLKICIAALVILFNNRELFMVAEEHAIMFITRMK